MTMLLSIKVKIFFFVRKAGRKTAGPPGLGYTDLKYWYQFSLLKNWLNFNSKCKIQSAKFKMLMVFVRNFTFSILQ
jgi:hypothetical protein